MCTSTLKYKRVKGKDNHPLFFSDKPPSEFCSYKTAKFLKTKTEEHKKYFIWGSEIVKYEELRNTKKEVVGKFTVWTFSCPRNGQKLLFEMKRRSNFRIKEEVIEGYREVEGVEPQVKEKEVLLCKLELVDRLIFNLHMKPLEQGEKIKKGLEIFGNIMSKIDLEIKGY